MLLYENTCLLLLLLLVLMMITILIHVGLKKYIFIMFDGIVCSVITYFVDVDMLVSDRHCWCSCRN